MVNRSDDHKFSEMLKNAAAGAISCEEFAGRFWSFLDNVFEREATQVIFDYLMEDMNIGYDLADPYAQQQLAASADLIDRGASVEDVKKYFRDG